MHFTINHYINGGLSDAKIDSLHHDLHFQYSTHTLDIPLSLIEMKNCIKQIPTKVICHKSERRIKNTDFLGNNECTS